MHTKLFCSERLYGKIIWPVAWVYHQSGHWPWLHAYDRDEELLGVATAPPTRETGGSMLAMDPDRATGEGSKEQRRLNGHSCQEPPICIPSLPYSDCLNDSDNKKRSQMTLMPAGTRFLIDQKAFCEAKVDTSIQYTDVADQCWSIQCTNIDQPLHPHQDHHPPELNHRRFRTTLLLLFILIDCQDCELFASNEPKSTTQQVTSATAKNF